MKQYLGFTFIEVILLVAILLVVGATLLPLGSQFFIEKNTRGVVETLRSAIRSAQLSAIGGKEASAWGVALRDGRLVVFLGESYASRTSSRDETFDIPTGITLTGFDEVVAARMTGRLTGSLSALSVTSPTETISFSLSSEGALTETGL